MSQIINIYCDESCHLESSQISVDNRFMVLGGIACSEDDKHTVFEHIKKLKKENGLQPFFRSEVD